MKKDKMIHVRCTDEEKKKIESRASKAGITISEYALRSSLNAKTRISTSRKDAARTITQFQVSINEARFEILKCQNSAELNKVAAQIEKAQEGLNELWRLLK